MRKIFHFIILLTVFVIFIFPTVVNSRQKPSTIEDRMQAFEKRQQMQQQSLFKNMEYRSVGPVVMSGRIVDIEPSPNHPYSFYVAYATGGLWKTENNGMRFRSLFDNQNAITIGDIAIDPEDENIIWVGSGEKNSSRSSYAGTGIYKTTDGGKTWNYMGLGDSHHIARIVIHPQNTNLVYVAALGHLYTENEERGVYRTKDGGKTWKKILYVNSRTGFVDLVMDPNDPSILYAAAWEKARKAWNFIEGGKGSAIYKTTDGGDHWAKLTNGLPQGDFVGRIGLDIYRGDPTIIYALIDNQNQRPMADQVESASITPRKLLNMTTEDILSLDDDELGGFIRSFHPDYTLEAIREMLENKEITTKDLVDYVRKNNPQAFDLDIIGGEVYRSDDGGNSWHKTHNRYIDNFYSTYGYYFGEIRVSPNNPNKIYILGVPLLTSDNGGKMFEWRGGEGVHADHQALWIDPKFPNHIIDGNDGGLNLSYDGGKSWIKLNYLPVGQFYSVNVDMDEPYNIYGGLQDNGVFKGSSRSKPLESELWQRLMGGDGMQVQIDQEDNTVYTGFQFGNYYRIDQKTGQRKQITPRAKLEEPGLRYNWQTPILLSSHSSNVLYFGANRMYRSLDRGDSWEAISPDLSTNPKKIGDVPFATIVTIAESKQKFGVLYAGTDDGRLHVTRDGGVTWKEIDKNLPKGLWVSRVETSWFYDGTVYVSLNGYRNDDFRAYLYRSKNYGKSWESIVSNMPDEAINVIREDPFNPHVLYGGTDMGVFVSIDAGKSWQPLQTGMPLSPAHDMVIHPRDRELVVGTHGRSIYVMDVMPIEELTPAIMEKEVHVFALDDVQESSRLERKSLSSWSYPRDTTKIDIFYWLKQDGEVEFTVKDKNNNIVRTLRQDGNRGINTLKWNLAVDRDVVFNQLHKEAKEAFDSAGKKQNDARSVGKSDKEIQKFVIARKKAQRELEKITDLIQEGKEATSQLPPVYALAGKYMITANCNGFEDSTHLNVKPRPSRYRTSPEDRKRNQERKLEKIKKDILRQYK